MELFTVIEMTATITGLIQSGLVLFNKRSNWLFHLISNVCLVIFSFHTKLYADGAEAVIYATMAVIGWFTWAKSKDRPEIPTQWLTRNKQLIYLAVIAVLWGALYLGLSMTDDVNALCDSFTTASGLVATWLMTQRKVESWIVWFVNDCVYVYTYFTLETPAIGLMLMNFFWVFMAVGSFITWSKAAKQAKETDDKETRTSMA